MGGRWHERTLGCRREVVRSLPDYSLQGVCAKSFRSSRGGRAVGSLPRRRSGRPGDHDTTTGSGRVQLVHEPLSQSEPPLSTPEAEPASAKTKWSPTAHWVVDNGAPLVPFMKWAGGKRWFVYAHSDLLPGDFNTYVEPFLGGGSVFFHLRPKRAILGDANPDLICAYQGVQAYPHEVEEQLRCHHDRHSEEYYYQIRESEPDSLPGRAARVIYLNRTCFNGIYRVNRKGKFNVPIGSRNQVVFETDNFPAVSKLLKSARIYLSDFERTIDRARAGDLIFADPPYTVRHNNNGFVKYNETLFSWADQIRLAEALRRARDRGAKVVVTNAAHDTVKELYEPHGFRTKIVSRFSAIAADSRKRKTFDELVVLS